MAVGAGACDMSTRQYIIIVMYCKGRRSPSGVGGMTIGTGGWNTNGRMVGIRRVVVDRQMASHAGIRRIDIIAVMALNTVVCNRGMFAGQRIVTAMDGERCRFPPLCSGMAGGAGIGYVQRHVVGIGALIVNGSMTCCAIGRCSNETVGMTGTAWGRYMNPGEWEPAVIVVEASLNTSCRMTLITVKAYITVASNTVMLLVGLGLVVIMAVDAAE